MSGKISVIGDVPVTSTLTQGARGAEVIVAASGDGVRAALRLSPAAVVLLVDASPQDVDEVLRTTLLPSQRVVAVARADVQRAVEAATGGGVVTLRVNLRDGEREVRLGRGGVVG